MEELLTQLKLGRIREVYREWIDRASKEEMSYADFLNGLLIRIMVSNGTILCRRKAIEPHIISALSGNINCLK